MMVHATPELPIVLDSVISTSGVRVRSSGSSGVGSGATKGDAAAVASVALYLTGMTIPSSRSLVIVTVSSVPPAGASSTS